MMQNKMKKLTMKSMGFRNIKLSDNPQRQMVTYRALRFAIKELQEIAVNPGMYMGNNRCYNNARQHVEEGEAGVITAVIAFLPEVRGANLHFVNKDTTGCYTDNTYGYQSQFIRYFVLSDYKSVELDKNNKIYANIIDELGDMYLNIFFTKAEIEKYEIKKLHF